LAKDLVKDKNGKLNRGCSLKFSSTMKYLNWY
jgi:hypothetical protein